MNGEQQPHQAPQQPQAGQPHQAQQPRATTPPPESISPIFCQEVKPRDALFHPITLDQPGSLVRWLFYTRKKSIGFGLAFLPKAEERVAEDSAQVLLVSRSSLRMSHGPKSTVSRSGTPQPSDPNLSKHSSLEAMDSSPVDPVIRWLGPEAVTLLPIQRYEAAEQVIRGSYVAPIAGTYVLCFDNSFSIQTAKQVHFGVEVISNLQGAVDSDEVVHSGWLLKKKRRRMQGKAVFIL